ncbi:MAG: LytTR family DNA-binding domain-containing protein [Ruminococcus sp.]|nr:LytTR family DNA-binding domain-containing protein [Ruminococcus sp.]
MIKIAIADDEQNVRERIMLYLSKYFEVNPYKYEVVPFSSGEKLLASEMNFDLIFLDVEMEPLNGIETAIRIRKKDLTVPIVYITSYSKYWRTAYKVHAFGFIEKPLEVNDLFNVMNDFFEIQSNQAGSSVSLRTEEETIVLDADSIYYFLIGKNRTCTVFMEDKSYIVKENLNSIYEQLDKIQFYRAHRCCIVNLKYVVKINGFDVYMSNGDVLPIAQKRKKEFFEALHVYIHTHKG